jgi:hypothetical protein
MMYCSTCQNWHDRLPHEECTQGGNASAVFLDHGEGLLTCSICQQVWLMEDTEAVCPACKLPQQIAFREDTVQLQSGDRLLATDGALVYVRLESGSLLITHRSCLVLSEN